MTRRACSSRGRLSVFALLAVVALSGFAPRASLATATGEVTDEPGPLPEGGNLGLISPCPAPPSKICQTLPYTTVVAEQRLFPVPDKCEGGTVSQTVCQSLKLTESILKAAGTLPEHPKHESRVMPLHNESLYEHTPSVEVEYDHALTMMCHIRDVTLCARVYGLQEQYNNLYAQMANATAEAEKAFDEWEFAKQACADATKMLEEMNKAMRTKQKVCRDRVIKVQNNDLVAQLKAAKSNLLNPESGKCARDDLVQTITTPPPAPQPAEEETEAEDTNATNTSEVAEGQAPGGDAAESDLLDAKEPEDPDNTTVVNFTRRYDAPVKIPETHVEKGIDGSTVVLPSGFAMPGEYFDSCKEVVDKIDQMIALMSEQTVTETVCTEFTPGESKGIRDAWDKACGGLDSAREDYAAKLAEAERLKKLVSQLYKDLLAAEARARLHQELLDQIIAATSAAGADEEEAKALSKGASAAAVAMATDRPLDDLPVDTVKTLRDACSVSNIMGAAAPPPSDATPCSASRSMGPCTAKCMAAGGIVGFLVGALFFSRRSPPPKSSKR